MRAQRFSAVLASLALAACTQHDVSSTDHAQQTAQRAVSPLVGTWTRDGDTPKPDAKAPQFTKLTFAADGSLDATYVAAGGALAGVVGKAPKVESESDTYATPDATTLRIAEGSSQREYTYRVSGGKLYLTPSGGSDAAVFTKGSDPAS